MIQPGDTIENPVTGERLTFIETARQNGGEATVFEAQIAPGGHLPAPHLHPKQSERFEIVSGTLTVRLGGETVEAKPGDVVDIAAGVSHYFSNRTGEDVRFRVEVRPALGIEELLETMYGLAADGKANWLGMPNPLRLAVIAQEHFDVVRMPVVPASVQRLALAIGAPVGRLVGYTPGYVSRRRRPATLEPAYA
jgi:mannose-6-phosphate isomerase-like protein (cupin superfamily)